MKTIEEKVRAYNEAIKKAAALYKASEPMSGCNVILETLFPELAESEDEKVRKELIRFVKGYFPHETSEQRKAYLAWLEKQGNMTERVIWKEIPKDKDGFFDENSDLYDRLPIIITEEFGDCLYYIDEENWHETLADLSRQSFVHYIEVRELKNKVI